MFVLQRKMTFMSIAQKGTIAQKGKKSWCTYQCDIANGTTTHVPGKGLPSEVIKNVKEVFDELSDDNLLMKCLHGKTQNQNEAFNGTK